jgi:hypothetical protein
MRASTEQVEQIAQSKFVCSACGSGRDCDCNAPAREREAARREAQRQADARYAEKRKEKREQQQQPVDIDTDYAAASASAEARKAVYAEEEEEETLTPEEERRRHALFRQNLGEVLAKHDDAGAEPEDDDPIDWSKEWAAEAKRAEKLEKRNDELSKALNAKEVQAARNWPPDMTPQQVKKRDRLLGYIAWNQRDLEQLYGEVTGQPSWRVEVTTKDCKRWGTGARFGTRGEAEFYNTHFAPSERGGLGEEYATGEIIACQEKANVLIEGDSIRFNHGGCVLLSRSNYRRRPTASASPIA